MENSDFAFFSKNITYKKKITIYLQPNKIKSTST